MPSLRRRRLTSVRSSTRATQRERRWRAFLWLCETLAQSLDGVGGPPTTWPSDPEDVEQLVTLAGHNLVTPALAWAMRGNDTVPADVGEYLDATLYLNRQRNARMLDGLEIAARALAACGIEPILLKGAANITGGLYADPAMRMANDLDLLVTAEQAPAACEALAREGFDDFEGGSDARVSYAEHHHLAMQRHRDTGIGIELHHEVLQAPYGRMLDSARLRRSALPMVFRGSLLGVPSPTHRVLHNIVHDQLVDGAYARRSASLRQLLDLSLLCQRDGDAIDWGELEASFSPQHPRVLRYALGNARLLGAAPPLGSLSESLTRLRKGVENPRSFVGPAVRFAAAGVRLARRPENVLKLLVPATWPGRLERWAEFTRRPQA